MKRSVAIAACVLSFVAAAREARAQERGTTATEAPSAIEPDSGTPSAFLATLHRVRWGGFIQADWVAMNQRSQDEIDTSGQPINQDRFVLRRARMRADIDRGIFAGALEIDANTVNGPQMRPINAEVSLKWPPGPAPNRDFDIALSLGLIQTPFGFENLELDPQRPFLERSNVTNAFFPGVYDLGARIRGRYKFLHWAIGAMNGDPIGEKTFPGRDPNKSKDLDFRVGVDTAITRHVSIDAGFSGLTGSGFHAGTPTTKDQLVWRDTNEDGIVDSTEIQVIAGTAATPSQTFHRFGLGADAQLAVRFPFIGKMQLRGEVVRGTNLDRGMFISDPVTLGRDVRGFGWYVGLSQEVTRYGLIGIRYDEYDPDQDANEQQGLAFVPRDNTLSTLAILGGVKLPNDRGPGHVGRLLFEYDKNQNKLGRGTNGLPTNLASDTAILRAEIVF